MSLYPMIKVALGGDRSGFVIAVLAFEGEENMPSSQQLHRGATLVVGSVYRVSPDGDPEEWKAWLWPVAGGTGMRTGQSVEAMETRSLPVLKRKLQKRADQGAWWA